MVRHPRDQARQGPVRVKPKIRRRRPPTGGERVAKALARAGVASRREVERLIEAGRVALNGAVLDTPAVKVAPRRHPDVDGQVVGAAEPTRLWRYHKPAGPGDHPQRPAGAARRCSSTCPRACRG